MTILISGLLVQSQLEKPARRRRQQNHHHNDNNNAQSTTNEEKKKPHLAKVNLCYKFKKT